LNGVDPAKLLGIKRIEDTKLNWGIWFNLGVTRGYPCETVALALGNGEFDCDETGFSIFAVKFLALR
jgi:hypothetical protein